MNIGIFEAVKSLHPSAKPDIDYLLQDDGKGAYIRSWTFSQPKPTDEELAAEIARLQAEAAASAYKAKRASEYPAIGDQLDALFHAGVFPPEMAAMIQAVKDKYPKEQS